MSDTLRRWRFSVLDWADAEYWLSESGETVREDEAWEFVGTDWDAVQMSERLADLWEESEKALASRVTHHSMGVVTQ